MTPAYAVTRRRHRAALRLVDTLGALLLGWRRPRPVPAAGDAVRRLLLIRRQGFGDLITLQPAIARARELFPRARITLMTGPQYRPFLDLAGWVDEVWCVPSLAAALAQAARARLARRRPHFDLAFDCHADLGHVVLGRLWARRLVGHAHRGGGFLLDIAAPYPPRLDAASRHLRLVEAAAPGPLSPHPGSAPCLVLAPAWRRAAAALLAGIPPGFIVIHPGCGQSSKRWPFARWCELLARCGDRGHAVVLTGEADERALCAALAARPGVEVWDFSGKTDWGALAAVVAEAACVVAPDTGVIHLAQAVGTPTVALFGPQDPVVWGYGDGGLHRSLVRKQPCSFCARGRCPRPEVRTGSGLPSPCMAAIPVAEVAQTVEAVLAAATRRSFTATR